MPAAPLVSVLVTIYNRDDYVLDCLESILSSSFEDFEVIAVDDQSTDDSVAVVEGCAAHDSRIRLHRNPENLGDYRNRNRAAELARGKYLKYLDADDLIYPHALGVFVDAMDRNPEAALALSLNTIDPAVPFPFQTDSRETVRRHFLGGGLLGVGPSASIIRREAFERVGGFSGRQFIGDTELWLKLASRWPVVSLPPALVWWRRHEGQQMNLEMSRPEVLVKRYLLDFDVLENTSFLDLQEKAKVRGRLKQHHARRLLALAIKGGRPRVAFRLARDSGLTAREMLRGIRPYQRR